jgi:hypothetical protein
MNAAKRAIDNALDPKNESLSRRHDRLARASCDGFR